MTDRPIANGLQPDGDNRLATQVVTKKTSEMIGLGASTTTTTDILRNKGFKPQFHVVIQLRSSPDAPLQLCPLGGGALDWSDRSTRRATMTVEPWGSLGRIDDTDRREAFQTAESLVNTGVWTLRPAPDPLPADVTLEVATRG